jgi:hypothetical protein
MNNIIWLIITHPSHSPFHNPAALSLPHSCRRQPFLSPLWDRNVNIGYSLNRTKKSCVCCSYCSAFVAGPGGASTSEKRKEEAGRAGRGVGTI